LKIVPFQRLACPLDQLPLRRDRSRWFCDGGHSFDIAGEGYVHLLPVQRKRSRDPGDSKAMVAARRRFLGAGFYQRISEAVNRALLPAGSPGELSCVDAGCGEGYYLRELAAAHDGATLALLGVDISKWAIRAAARQDSRPTWVVASNAGLPVEPASIDRVLCLFGFPVYKEFARVLKPRGLLVQADAGPGHLRELRDIIYPQERTSRSGPQTAPEGFSHRGTETVGYTLTIPGGEMIESLLAMTPHYFRSSAEGRARLLRLESLKVSVEVRVSTFCYQPDS
jgi:23S rRNA (guanine745-N1)-methyltransferase